MLALHPSRSRSSNRHEDASVSQFNLSPSAHRATLLAAHARLHEKTLLLPLALDLRAGYNTPGLVKYLGQADDARASSKFRFGWSATRSGESRMSWHPDGCIQLIGDVLNTQKPLDGTLRDDLDLVIVLIRETRDPEFTACEIPRSSQSAGILSWRTQRKSASLVLIQEPDRTPFGKEGPVRTSRTPATDAWDGYHEFCGLYV
ncbi:hypothetical protein B0H19DRAFT_1083153 [Mycena capillaripes]|nr:hypothetical protein B0H19DRAFT_1083153 [Mycena capillaripes]